MVFVGDADVRAERAAFGSKQAKFSWQLVADCQTGTVYSDKKVIPRLHFSLQRDAANVLLIVVNYLAHFP